jgi:hypothetical protein
MSYYPFLGLRGCLACGELGRPTCGTAACIRIWRCMVIAQGLPDPMRSPQRHSQ